jgi:hypothetical protein
LAELCAWAGAIFTLGLGLGGMILPKLAQRITLLAPIAGKPKAIAEVRASFGGLYFGLGLAVIMALIGGNGVVGTSFAAACAWLGLAIGRTVSLAADRSGSAWNWISLAIEIVTGLLLMAPFIAHIGGGPAS